MKITDLAVGERFLFTKEFKLIKNTEYLDGEVIEFSPDNAWAKIKWYNKDNDEIFEWVDTATFKVHSRLDRKINFVDDFLSLIENCIWICDTDKGNNLGYYKGAKIQIEEALKNGWGRSRQDQILYRTVYLENPKNSNNIYIPLVDLMTYFRIFDIRRDTENQTTKDCQEKIATESEYIKAMREPSDGVLDRATLILYNIMSGKKPKGMKMPSTLERMSAYEKVLRGIKNKKEEV